MSDIQMNLVFLLDSILIDPINSRTSYCNHSDFIKMIFSWQIKWLFYSIMGSGKMFSKLYHPDNTHFCGPSSWSIWTVQTISISTMVQHPLWIFFFFLSFVGVHTVLFYLPKYKDGHTRDDQLIRPIWSIKTCTNLHLGDTDFLTLS